MLERRVEKRTQELKDAVAELQILKNKLQAEKVYLREEIKQDHNFDKIMLERVRSLKKDMSELSRLPYRRDGYGFGGNRNGKRTYCTCRTQFKRSGGSTTCKGELCVIAIL